MENKNSPPRKPFGVNRSARGRSSNQTERPAPTREMTYHVGWKTGKINSDLHPHQQMQVQPEPHPQLYAHVHPHTYPLAEYNSGGPLAAKFLRFAWHPAPWLPRRAFHPLLWCAPAICFAVTLAVVALLKY
jgi:hypothetical protein